MLRARGPLHIYLGFLLTTRALSSDLTRTTMSAAGYYRQDGVRITHDPDAPGMAEKYGRPGETDNDGFDPYADTVGAGIYGGIVKRDALGQVIVGEQYQSHNPRPGPVYGGGGYTPMSKALKSPSELVRLLDKYPDLVNDVSTGGALPLHNCGMSQANQLQTEALIIRGADIEAMDTYGYTPLHRMASNNLAVGAQALLDWGADPDSKGGAGQTPSQVARSSGAKDVLRVLESSRGVRAGVPVAKIAVSGGGFADTNTDFAVMEPDTIPVGFEKVCMENGWATEDTWQRLNGGRQWFHAENGSYIYFNTADKHWWIDGPSGAGIYKAPGPAHAPPAQGWKLLGEYMPTPSLRIYRKQPARGSEL